LWDDVAQGLWDRKPRFLINPPAYVTAEVSDFVLSKMPAGTLLPRSQ
jgi:hypothetical protein